MTQGHLTPLLCYYAISLLCYVRVGWLDQSRQCSLMINFTVHLITQVWPALIIELPVTHQLAYIPDWASWQLAKPSRWWIKWVDMPSGIIVRFLGTCNRYWLSSATSCHPVFRDQISKRVISDVPGWSSNNGHMFLKTTASHKLIGFMEIFCTGPTDFIWNPHTLFAMIWIILISIIMGKNRVKISSPTW